MKNNIENKPTSRVKIVGARPGVPEISNIPLTKIETSESFWVLIFKKTKRIVEVLLLEDEYLEWDNKKNL